MSKLPVLTDEQMCFACGGGCCSYTTLNIGFRTFRGRLDRQLEKWVKDGVLMDLVRTDGRIPDMSWLTYTEKDRSSGMKDERFLVFHCNHRDENGRCGIYDTRPQMCRDFKCTALTGEDSLSGMLSSTPPRRKNDVYWRDVTDTVTKAIKSCKVVHSK